MPTSQPAGRRIRHEVKFRMLKVIRANALNHSMIRATLSGDELPGFTTAAHDDHVKVFFPAVGSDRPVLPALGPDGLVFPDSAPRPTARDYTPQRYDPGANELDIDFVLHGDGPASSWAAKVRPGQFLGVGGPRGSYVLSDEFDWYLLIGDETAIPAISRRLRELPAHSHAIVIAEVTGSEDEHRFESMARVDTTWLHRGAAEPGTTALLARAVADIPLPSGSGYAWVAGESETARTIRRLLVDERGLTKERIKAAGYWKRGASAIHETHSD
jgi:NADPH-dependent ferric siderophore reductase